MEVPIEVRLQDLDSERYVLVVRGTSVPPGSILYGASGQLTANATTGDFTLTPADVNAFYYEAPDNWSDVSYFNALATPSLFC
jgi:hypothetical protein